MLKYQTAHLGFNSDTIRLDNIKNHKSRIDLASQPLAP
ncbi:MAG: hypothetical protein ACI971_001652, partial [Colwellia sp.]